MKLKTDISISKPSNNRDEKYIEVRLKDDASNITFATVKVPLEGFMEALTGLGGIDCETEVRGLEFVGKTKEIERVTAFLSKDEHSRVVKGLMWEEQKRALGKWLETKHARDGWMVDTYLGSQSSIRFVEGGHMISFAYYRYVTKGQE